MSESPLSLNAQGSHEPGSTTTFSLFILTHPVITNSEPTITEVDFDLDETLFKYHRDAPTGKLVANWRSGTPELIEGLRQMGFVKINVLSSKSQVEIQAAMDIYRLQFGDENAAKAFDNTMATRDYDELGNKYEALPEVARQAANQGRHVVFVDDSNLSFDDDAPFGFINVPPDMQYRGDNSELYTVDLSLTTPE